MLSEFFHWWARQMLDLLPSGLGRPDVGRANALVIRLRDLTTAMASVTALRRVRGIETPLGSFELDSAGIDRLRAVAMRRKVGVLLEVEPALLLEREAVLPLAAEGDIERVLGYEMDRITPFTAAELFWAWHMVRRNRTLGKLNIRLSMIHRSGLAPVLDALRAAGLEPAMIAAPAPDQTMRYIPLVRVAVAPARQRRALGWATALCAALLIATIAKPLVLNERGIRAADARIEGLKPRVAEVELLRRRQAAEINGADVFAAASARVGSPLQALAGLTDILPDDTWLSALSLRQRVLTFTGQSARAARLITTLSAEPAWRNPVFATPVTRADSGGSDQFSIHTELAP